MLRPMPRTDTKGTAVGMFCGPQRLSVAVDIWKRSTYLKYVSHMTQIGGAITVRPPQDWRAYINLVGIHRKQYHLIAISLLHIGLGIIQTIVLRLLYFL
jgi:hypothetical protein